MEDATFLSKPRRLTTKKIRILIISEPATNISGGIYIELSRGSKTLLCPIMAKPFKFLLYRTFTMEEEGILWIFNIQDILHRFYRDSV